MILTIIINPMLTHTVNVVLQTISIVTLITMMLTNVRVLVQSTYTLSNFMKSVYMSYLSFFRNTLCPKKDQVVLRYYSNEKYVLHSLSIFFELCMVLWLLADLYNANVDKPLVAHLGLIGFFVTCTLINIQKYDKRKNS